MSLDYETAFRWCRGGRGAVGCALRRRPARLQLLPNYVVRLVIPNYVWTAIYPGAFIPLVVWRPNGWWSVDNHCIHLKWVVKIVEEYGPCGLDGRPALSTDWRGCWTFIDSDGDERPFARKHIGRGPAAHKDFFQQFHPKVKQWLNSK